MKNFSFKKFASSLLLSVIAICLLSINSFAVSQPGRFSSNINSAKDDYSKGEEIEFYAEISNDSYNDLYSVVFEATPSDDKGLFTAGINNQTFKCFPAGDKQKMSFSLCEESNILETGAAIAGISALLFSVYAFFIKKYYSVATIYITLSLIFTSVFSSFTIQPERLNFSRETETLGIYSVNYDGEEYSFKLQVSYEKPKKQSEFKDKMLGVAEDNSYIEANFSFKRDDRCGIIFSAESEDFSPEKINGYLFLADRKINEARIYSCEGGKYTLIASKPFEIPEICKLRVEYTASALKAYIFGNNSDVYPIFDLPFTSTGKFYGVRSIRDNFDNAATGKLKNLPTAATYTNPVKANMPDPYILKYDGTYYLYGTDMPGSGFGVYTSQDLVNWQPAGVCAKKGEILGNDGFWAPEVYYANNQFYMLYTADEFLCMAVSKSPTGPFVKTSDNYIFSDFLSIDGNLLFDDDGSVYLYFSKVIKDSGRPQQQIWGCKMNDDLLSADRSTLTHLTSASEWEGRTNEGPFVIKHNGIYYLSYSGNAYTSEDYSVGYATAKSPLGKFIKYKQNPILMHDRYVFGPGHHCFVMSPDDSEMFIVYHSHKSESEVHPRNLCIDRIKFIKDDSGNEIMSVYGPTITPQPMPSNSF